MWNERGRRGRIGWTKGREIKWFRKRRYVERKGKKGKARMKKGKGNKMVKEKEITWKERGRKGRIG